MKHYRRRESDKNLQGGGWKPSKKGGKQGKGADNVGYYSLEIGKRNERAEGQ